MYVFNKDFIDYVKNTINLEELASEYTKLKRVNKYLYQGICPNPKHEDHNASFTIWKRGHLNNGIPQEFDTWACMGCHCGKMNIDNNCGSDCIAFISWIKNKNFYDAMLYLCEQYNIQLPKQANNVLYKNNYDTAINYFNSLNDKTINYLLNRGLSKDDIALWRIGYDKYNDRIVFPLFDRYNNILGFSKRTFIDSKDIEKYINSPSSPIFDKGNFFYGFNKFDVNCDNIKITEGQLDVILSYKYGVKNIFATLGTAFTYKHINLIKKLGKTPIFCMDGDEAGLKATKRAIDMLIKENIYSKILILPNGYDMADIALKYKDKTEQYILDNSVTYGNFLIQNKINSYISKVTELKLLYYAKLYDILKDVPEPEKNILLNTIKSIFNMEIKMF